MTNEKQTLIDQLEAGALCQFKYDIDTGITHYTGDIVKPTGLTVMNGHWEVIFEYEDVGGTEQDQVNLAQWLDIAKRLS